uniref:Titin n=1 Tax=Leptobrachium leishanense TaxID=445787 RepID=A0A8C5WLN5_9ANUR
WIRTREVIILLVPRITDDSKASCETSNEVGRVFDCELNKDRDVTWTKDGKRLQDAPGKYQINIIGLNRTLTIVSADDDDAGVYACTVDNTSVSCDSNVKVVGKLHTRNYTAVEKDDIVLQCEVSKAKAPVKWFKDGQEIIPSKNVIIKTDGKKRILTIKKASKKDIGEYTCDCGTDQTTSKLNIEGKTIWNHTKYSYFVSTAVPKIKTADQNIVIDAGKPLTMNVAVPSPTITWHKDGRDIKIGDRVAHKSDYTSATLEVANVIRADAVKAGEPVNIPADVTGLPLPKIEWSKNEVLMEKSTPAVKIEKQELSRSDAKTEVIIASAQRGDRGTYTITASNRLGSVYRSANVEVFDTDSFSTVLTLKECTRKDTGEYLLTVSNIAGSKTVALHLTVLDVPGPPTGPLNILEITPDHMVIAWRPPKDDGGSPVINYVVEKCEGKKLTWSIVSTGSTQTKAKVPRLQKGFEYTFRVRAENKMGIGNPLESQPTVAKHMFDPPSPPGKPVAYDITENAATVSWTMPKSDGGSPISGYIVERREISGKWVRVNKTPVLDLKYRATGLYEGNTYEFRVFAENIAGQSPVVETKTPILAINPIDKPGEPENLHIAEVGKSFVYLKWRRPDYDGGSPNLTYHVERKLKDSDEWERVHKGSIKETNYLIEKCHENQFYQFRVQTKNEGGESNWVKTAEVLVKEELVKPVLDLKLIGTLVVKAGDTIRIEAGVRGKPQPEVTWSKDKVADSTKTSITLGWGKPVYDGGAPIIGYIVEMRPKLERKDPEEGWKRCNAAAQLIHTQFTVTSLSDKEEYEFRVSAQNQVGVGRPAELKEAVTPKEILGNFKLLKINKICSSRKLLSQFSNDLCLIAHRTSRN